MKVINMLSHLLTVKEKCEICEKEQKAMGMAFDFIGDVGLLIGVCAFFYGFYLFLQEDYRRSQRPSLLDKLRERQPLVPSEQKTDKPTEKKESRSVSQLNKETKDKINIKTVVEKEKLQQTNAKSKSKKPRLVNKWRRNFREENEASQSVPHPTSVKKKEESTVSSDSTSKELIDKYSTKKIVKLIQKSDDKDAIYKEIGNHIYNINKDGVIGTLSINPNLLIELQLEGIKVLLNLCASGNVIQGESKGKVGLIFINKTQDKLKSKEKSKNGSEEKCKEKYLDQNAYPTLIKLKNCEHDIRFFAVPKPQGKTNEFYVTAYLPTHKDQKILMVH